MNKLQLFAKHFHNLGLNITCISNELTEYNFYSPNILKAAYHSWEHLLNKRQSEKELLDYNWETATGLGVVAGFENLHVLDIDGCSNEEFVNDILELLGLPKNYEWVVKSGSQDGFHIHFFSNLLEDTEVDRMCSSYPANEDNFGLFEKMELLWNTNVVLPNSIHKSGQKYKFLNSNLPKYKPQHIEIKRFSKISKLFLNRSKMIVKKSETYYDPPTYTKLIGLEQPSNLYDIELAELNRELLFIFDTETDGLINENSFPNIVQISWSIMDFDGIIHKKKTELINCDFDVNSKAFEVNRLSPKVIKELGISPEDGYQTIAYDLKYCSTIIAHNIDFDLKILENEFVKYGIDFNFKEIRKFCTMKWGVNQLKTNSNPNPKFPKMTEVYENIFHHKIKQYHNAHSDVVILSKIVKAIISKSKQ